MNLFKLVATVGLDTSEYDKGVDKARSDGKSLATSLGQSLGGVAKAGGKALGAAAKATASAVAAGATGVVALTTAAVKSYADYEQLVGGVDTLFKDSSSKVQEYAAEAYKSAGLSANEYMETVTGFSASLIQSLGGDTQKAAEIADMAIIDMSDNANKMGTDIKSIQFAYQGFAKQNYTMLDNLRIGYGGTKSEMERLISDANKVKEANGEMADLSIESFADVTEAIHIIQSEMDITGTTAKEASETITGSLNSAKSAFKNMITAIADDNADFDKAVSQFVDSVTTAGKNILPRVEVALKGVGRLINQLFPVIMREVPRIITDMLPDIVQSGVDILDSLIEGINENFDTIVDTVFEVGEVLLDAFFDLLPDIVEMGTELLNTLMESFADNSDTIAERVLEVTETLINAFIDLLPTMIETGTQMLVSLMDAMAEDPDKVVETALEIIETLASGLIEALPKLIGSAAELVAGLVGAIIDHLPEIFETGIDILGELVDGISDALGGIYDAGWDIIESVMDGIADAWKGLAEWFEGLWDDLFGNRNVNVNVNGGTTTDRNGYSGSGGKFGGGSKPRPGSPASGWHPNYRRRIDGSHADGLDYVPFDGYIAELHKGERVLTADEARTGGTVVNATININGGDFGDRRDLAEYLAETLQTLTDRRGAVYA